MSFNATAARRPTVHEAYPHPIPDTQTPLVDRLPSAASMASSSLGAGPSGRRKERDVSPSPIRDSNWFDVPLVFALVPAIGSLLTGSDLLKDFLHVAFLLYYLHNLIKVPWTLYTAARARRSHPSVRVSPDDRLRALARSELRMAELIYLVFTIVAPFLGALLLRSTSKLLSIDTVSTFSTSLFVLATGIRPWRHLVDLLRRRTEALHDVVHSPSADATTSRIEALEAELSELRGAIYGTDRGESTSIIEAATTSLDLARKEIQLHVKQAEATRKAYEARIEVLEAAFRQHQRREAEDRAPSYSPPYDDARAAALTLTIPKGLVRHPFSFLGGVLGGSGGKKGGSVAYGRGRSGLQGRGLGDEFRAGEKTDDEGSDGGERVHRRSPRSDEEEPNGLIERLVHAALFPLRLIRACALILLRQVG